MTLPYPNSFFSTHSNFPFSSKRNIRLCVCGEGAGGGGGGCVGVEKVKVGEGKITTRVMT